MAKGDRNMGWPGFFRVFTVLCAIMLLLVQHYLDLTAPRLRSPADAVCL